MTKTTINLTTAPVTRFDIIETEDGETIRLFHKRNLLGRFSTDEIARGDDWDAQLEQFIGAGQHNYTDCEDFLITEGDEDSEDGDEGEEGATGSVVPEKYRVKYGAAQNCGDEIATALTEFVTLPRTTGKNPDGGLDRAKLHGVAEMNGLGDKLAGWEDRGLNGGLLRMNTSNVLRGMNRRGEKVTIGAKVWPAREVEKKARKRAVKAKA